MASVNASAPSAFLNIPYDEVFRDLYLAYIAGISAFGLAPRATLEIPGGATRLDRILELIQSCRYSFHDLSRVELDSSPPPTPRFNMPFELGLALGWAQWGTADHTWFLFESQPYRAQKSLSDLSGSDPYIHNGERQGVFRELCNALVREAHQPTVNQMEAVYQRIGKALPTLMEQSGAQSPFQARVFRELVVLARPLADEVLHTTIHAVVTATESHVAVSEASRKPAEANIKRAVEAMNREDATLDESMRQKREHLKKRLDHPS